MCDEIEKEESDLIHLAKKGDHFAMSMLLKKYYTFLVKYLIKITFNPHIAEDLAQETMIKCIEKIRLYNGKSKFSSWLITIGTRLYIDQQRKKKREQHCQEQEQNLRKLRWQFHSHNESWNEALEALGRLNQDIRIPIILKHYYGYTNEEIAQMMNIPEGTVKSRIHNGLHTLRKELTEC